MNSTHTGYSDSWICPFPLMKCHTRCPDWQRCIDVDRKKAYRKRRDIVWSVSFASAVLLGAFLAWLYSEVF
jgi:hypothetical protein